MATNLDNQLLNRNDRDGVTGTDSAAQKLSGSETAGAQPQPSLREAVLAEKRRRIMKERKEAQVSVQSGVAGAIASPMQAATSRLLRQSWLHLVDSFGLTLLWINVHVFLKMILGEKVFCKLGDEWKIGLPAGDNVKAPKMTGLAEAMALGALDLLAVCVLIFAFSVVAMIVGVVSNPLEVIKSILGSLWGSVTGSK